MYLRGDQVGATAFGAQLPPTGPTLPVGWWFLAILVVDFRFPLATLTLSDGQQLIPVNKGQVCTRTLIRSH